MVRHSKEPCYYCGKPSTSTEHAPPKSMFKGFDCDSITAPACSLHNTEKSGNDQVLINAFIQSLINYKKDFKFTFHPDIEKSISLFSQNLHYSKNRIKNINVIDDQSFEPQKLAELTHVKGNPEDWIIQITAVLVWDAIKYYEKEIDWNNSVFYSNNWLPSTKDQYVPLERIKEIDSREQNLRSLEKTVNWKQGWTSRPKPYPNQLYEFYLSFNSDTKKVIFKHCFYVKFEFLVINEMPEDVIKILKSN